MKKDRCVAANSEFTMLKKKVLKASVEEISAEAEHARIAWMFLIGFAALPSKNFYRNYIIQIFNKLTQVPSWVTVWETTAELHQKVQALHEDLQAALGAQHEVLRNSIAASALMSIHLVRRNEQPEQVRQDLEKERIVDQIREEAKKAGSGCHNAAFGGTEHEDEQEEEEEDSPEAKPSTAVGATLEPLPALQEAIDAVVALDDKHRLETGGLQALNKLRIGCVKCAGCEDYFEPETSSALAVFSFILAYVKVNKDAVNGAAEVFHLLMASPSWSAIFLASMPLKESLQDLPVETQVALGLQNEKVFHQISLQAQQKARGGDGFAAAKEVALKMQSLRPACSRKAKEPEAEPVATAQAPSAVATEDGWKEARTPEGHSYYYNSRTRESSWERPAALGGPRVYKDGDVVEVWSNGMRAWGRGKVQKVEDGKVTAEFTLPGGGIAKKELPAGHKDLRPAPPSPAAESWSHEEKAVYRSWFDALSGSSDSKPAATVAYFIGKSGLKRGVLKQVWAVANPGSQTHLGFQDFARCCRLVAHCQAMGDSPLIVEADRPLRVKLRTWCLVERPPALPTFQR